MFYIVKQKIIGSIEYIVNSEDPTNEVINLTNLAEPMQSTLDLEYTPCLEIRKLSEKEIGDPVVKSAILRLSKKLDKESNEGTVRQRKKRTASKKTV